MSPGHGQDSSYAAEDPFCATRAVDGLSATVATRLAKTVSSLHPAICLGIMF